MSNEDIRWHQRLHNYNKALAELNNAVHITNEGELSKRRATGLDSII